MCVCVCSEGGGGGGHDEGCRWRREDGGGGSGVTPLCCSTDFLLGKLAAMTRVKANRTICWEVVVSGNLISLSEVQVCT